MSFLFASGHRNSAACFWKYRLDLTFLRGTRFPILNNLDVVSHPPIAWIKRRFSQIVLPSDFFVSFTFHDLWSLLAFNFDSDLRWILNGVSLSWLERSTSRSVSSPISMVSLYSAQTIAVCTIRVSASASACTTACPDCCKWCPSRLTNSCLLCLLDRHKSFGSVQIISLAIALMDLFHPHAILNECNP